MTTKPSPDATCSTKPCGSCPYLRTSPVGFWSPEEYQKLQQQDRDELGGARFGCHLDDGSLCRGWVADQKRRGVPSIRLRLSLIQNDATRGLFEAVDEKDPDLYASIAEMVAANAGRRFPSRNKRAVVIAEKIQRRQRRRSR